MEVYNKFSRKIGETLGMWRGLERIFTKWGKKIKECK